MQRWALSLGGSGWLILAAAPGAGVWDGGGRLRGRLCHTPWWGPCGAGPWCPPAGDPCVLWVGPTLPAVAEGAVVVSLVDGCFLGSVGVCVWSWGFGVGKAVMKLSPWVDWLLFPALGPLGEAAGD